MKITRQAQLNNDGENIKGIIISTDKPCTEIYDGRPCNVILSHAPDAVIMDWVADGIPIRYMHGGEVVARGLNVTCDGHALISNEVIWSDSTLGTKIKADVLKGILNDISVEADYCPSDCTVTRGANVDTVTVNKWRVLSCAVVVNHADTDCKVIRDVDGETEQPKEETEKTDSDTAAEAAEQPTAEATAEAAETENKDDVDNNRVAVAEADSTASDGDTVSAETAKTAENENKKEEEKRSMSYSITKAIRSQMKDARNVDASHEYEVSDTLARDYGTQAKGIFVDVRRDAPTAMNTTTDAGLLHIEQHPEAYVDALYSNLVITEAGAKVLDGLVGTVNIPVCSSKATGYWVAENGDITGSVPEIDTLVLAPKQVSALVDISYQLLRSGLPAADALISDQIEKQIKRAVQAAALEGSSDGATQPKGILKMLGEDVEAWADVPTFAELVALEGKLEDGVDNGNLAYMMTNSMFAALRAVPLNEGGGDRFVGEYINGRPMVLDRPCFITSDMPADTVLFGNFGEGLIIGQHSPIDILVDESSLSKKMGTRIVASALVSVGVLKNRFVAGAVADSSSSSSSGQ